MKPAVTIAGRSIGAGFPVFVIAEISANHQGSLERSKALIAAAAEAGADAVKFQTYRPDTMTLDVRTPTFEVGAGTPWAGRNLYDLYSEAQTPWEWMPDLFDVARESGLIPFSSPFDRTAIDLLVELDSPALKIASFELVDLELITAAASTGRPLLMSTGMATVDEIDEAVRAAEAGGCEDVILLRCNSSYPAAPSEMDLATIADMRRRWEVPVGLSDHTLSDVAAITAVGLGAAVLEKHLTLDRGEPGPDSEFSIEPSELRRLVSSVRETDAVVGAVRYGPSASEVKSLRFRRSIFVVADVVAGEPLTRENVAVIRPADGLAPRYLTDVLGRRAASDLERGTPLSWTMLEPEDA